MRRDGGGKLPFVTVSYAQSIDGSIAAMPGKRLRLSGRGSLAYVHRLRAEHDAILVGIGTVLADDPKLTVRYAGGSDPQPVVVDSRLRIPRNAYLLRRHPLPLWIAAGEDADPARRAGLESTGARVMAVPRGPQGFLDLFRLLKLLRLAGMRSVMVEGGERIIASFFSGRLVDRIVVTVAPVFVGGVRLLGTLARPLPALPRLVRVRSARLGNDIVLDGEPAWGGRR